MRTTLNLDDQLIVSAKHQALEESVPLARVIENALRKSFARPKTPRETVRLITASGPGVKPGVDLDNGRSLFDIEMDSAALYQH